MKDNTTNNNKNQYHHLTKEDRVKIETLSSIKDEDGKRKYSNQYIAKELGVHKSTIGRELKNRIRSKINIRSGKIKNIPYNATDAQNMKNIAIKVSNVDGKPLKNDTFITNIMKNLKKLLKNTIFYFT